MQVLDASSIIYAWDNYPASQFPGLWKWIAGEMQSRALVISSVAYGEAAKVAPDCETWLAGHDVAQLGISEAILLDALRIKHLLGVKDDRYGAGVGENDLLIVATARAYGGILISDERVQLKLPLSLLNYKIPAVCAMPDVNVVCRNFLDYIKLSKVVFG